MQPSRRASSMRERIQLRSLRESTAPSILSARWHQITSTLKTKISLWYRAIKLILKSISICRSSYSNLGTPSHKLWRTLLRNTVWPNFLSKYLVDRYILFARVANKSLPISTKLIVGIILKTSHTWPMVASLASTVAVESIFWQKAKQSASKEASCIIKLTQVANEGSTWAWAMRIQRWAQSRRR